MMILHGEAFMLMAYQCDSGHTETIWNSKDQVTPFVVTCKCGLPSRHINWQDDIRVVDYLPIVGMRIFYPANAESLLYKAAEYVDRHWERELPHDIPSMKDHPLFKELGKDGSAEYMAKEWAADDVPELIEVTEVVRKWFL